ncbi:hypothetical protein ACRALDRAFT_1080619 [Sodiomyces alcalophilus JCM 7366]|uniref:uncharacterized protein n=1 Tax=Sodiomyces alcalophilus JCM 7366 TaxID=591952 RepID=UPI0039B587A6
MRRFSSSVAITDPLVKYRSLVATGVYAPDPAQHRLARHLQEIYLRLKDYTPAREYRERLKEITDLAKKAKSGNGNSFLAVDNHPIWRNPLFRRLFTAPEGNHTRALTRVLTNHETALEIDSPKGLFLSGEVGTGKSMLIDLLSEGLPTHRKKRWHFNTFMLYTFSQLERFRRANPEMSGGDREYSLLWMAKRLVEESPILFLDEFQLPDRAASKILSHLFIAFFQLGGVLVASSNRIPEELQKAMGAEYVPPATGGFVKSLLSGRKTSHRGGELFGGSSDFSAFLDVLKARCDFWHMEGATDWRRVGGGSVTLSPLETSPPGNNDDVHSSAVAIDTAELGAVLQQDEDDSGISEGPKRPAKYCLPTDDEAIWRELWDHDAPGEWGPATLVVYGREVTIPRQRDGCVYWDFEKLVESSGPADYVTMASTYHTFIIDNVPVLTVLRKNEARRFITLLDALYEAKCKLFIRAAREPDELFFPETRARLDGKAEDGSAPVLHSDVLHSETIAEVHQDSAAPFRPNVSLYDSDSGTGRYDPDADSECGPENITGTSQHQGDKGKKLDFSDTSAFTGEDERFAYKRAASRLWEMCGEKWHARTGNWWRPLPPEARHWEKSPASTPRKIIIDQVKTAGSDMILGPSVTLEEPAGLQGLRIKSLKELDGEK